MKPRFFALEDIALEDLPFQRVPPEVVALREETASSLHSLEKEVDQFRPEEAKEGQREPVILVSNSKEELDRSSSVHTSRFIIARVDESSEEEKEMSHQRKGLHELLKG